MSGRSIYLIGSLRNENIPKISHTLREAGHEVFDDWYAAGPEADDYWQRYEKGKGNELPQALNGYAARHVFEFDKRHLDRCDTAVLALPAGRSGHLELGYASGRGKDCAILMEGEPDRYDVMYQFANLGVFYKQEDLIAALKQTKIVVKMLTGPMPPLRIEDYVRTTLDDTPRRIGNVNLFPNLCRVFSYG